MLLNKLKMTAVVVLVAGGITGGVGVWAYRASGSARSPVQDSQAAPTKVTGKAFVPIPAPKQAPRAGGRGPGPGTGKYFVPAPAPQPQPKPLFNPQPIAPGVPPAGFPPQGGFLGKPAGKNSPNLVGFRDQLPIFGTKSILVVESPDRMSWEAMSLESGNRTTWQKLSFPPGIQASPLAGEDTLALILKGKTIDHVAAFSMYTGEWSKQHLLKPVEDEINPVIGPGCALYQAGNDYYAFSSQQGKWGVLHLEGDEKPKAQVTTTCIQVLQGNTLYVFNLKLGEWSPGVTVNLRPFRSGSPRPAPAK